MPKNRHLALLAQPLEGRHDLVEHGFGGEIGSLGRADDRVVELEQIDLLELQPLQAGVERGGDRLRRSGRGSVGGRRTLVPT